MRILSAGEIYIDQIMSGFSSLPAAGEESFATSLVRQAGGGAAHTGAGLARLGWKSAVAGAVGREGGVYVRERLTELGVDISSVREDLSEPTGSTVVISTPADRAFLSYRGANVRFEEVIAGLPAADHLHMTATTSVEALLKIRARSGTLSIDSGWNPEWLGDAKVLDALRNVTSFFRTKRKAHSLPVRPIPKKCFADFTSLGFP